MAKNKDVAFVPIAPVKPEQAQEAPTKIDTPQYPDAGVNYANYSKSVFSGNTYRLNKQEPMNFYYLAGPILGVSNYTTGFPKEGKKVYITSMQLTFDIVAENSDSYFSLINGSDSSNIKFYLRNLRNGVVQFTFPVPLIFDTAYTGSAPSGLNIQISAGTSDINSCSINFQGWTE